MPLSLDEFWLAIARPMGIDRTGVDVRTTLRGDLDLDSLDMIEVFTIMEDLDCAVAEDDMSSLETVGDLYDHYRLQLAAVTP